MSYNFSNTCCWFVFANNFRSATQGRCPCTSREQSELVPKPHECSTVWYTNPGLELQEVEEMGVMK